MGDILPEMNMLFRSPEPKACKVSLFIAGVFVRLFTLSHISETAMPIKAKFHIEPP